MKEWSVSFSTVLSKRGGVHNGADMRIVLISRLSHIDKEKSNFVTGTYRVVLISLFGKKHRAQREGRRAPRTCRCHVEILK